MLWHKLIYIYIASYKQGQRWLGGWGHIFCLSLLAKRPNVLIIWATLMFLPFLALGKLTMVLRFNVSFSPVESKLWMLILDFGKKFFTYQRILCSSWNNKVEVMTPIFISFSTILFFFFFWTLKNCL